MVYLTKKFPFQDFLAIIKAHMLIFSMVALSHLINSLGLSFCLFLWTRILSRAPFHVRHVQSSNCCEPAECGGSVYYGMCHGYHGKQWAKERKLEGAQAPNCREAICGWVQRFSSIPQNIVVLTKGNLKILIRLTVSHCLIKVFKKMKYTAWDHVMCYRPSRKELCPSCGNRNNRLVGLSVQVYSCEILIFVI